MAGEQLAALIAQQPHLMLQAGLGAYQQANASRALGLQDRQAITQNILSGLGLASDIRTQKAQTDIAKAGNQRAQEAHGYQMAGMEREQRLMSALDRILTPEQRAQLQADMMGAQRDTTVAGAKTAGSQARVQQMTEGQQIEQAGQATQLQGEQLEAARRGNRVGAATEADMIEAPGIQNRLNAAQADYWQDRPALERAQSAAVAAGKRPTPEDIQKFVAGRIDAAEADYAQAVANIPPQFAFDEKAKAAYIEAMRQSTDARVKKLKQLEESNYFAGEKWNDPTYDPFVDYGVFMSDPTASAGAGGAQSRLESALEDG